MYQAIFGLLTAVGAWAAWRSNPTYSTKATVRFVAGVGAMGVTVLVAIIAVAEAAPKLPTAVAFASIFGVTFVGMLAMIWTIMAFTLPRVPPLPPGAKPVYLHRTKTGRWARRLVIALVVFAIAAAVSRGDIQMIVASLGGLVAFLGLTFLFTGYIAADRMDKSLAALEADPWMHWRYTAAEWQAWSNTETERLANSPSNFVWRRDWKRTLWMVVPTVVLVLIVQPGGWTWKIGYVAALLVLFFVVIEGANWGAKSAPRRLHAFLMGSAPESYFGVSGVFADGVYTEWLTVGNYLLEASIDERSPRSVALRFEVIQANALPLHVTRYVLMPPQPDADLARLQQLLSARCPSANVALTTVAPETTPAVLSAG